MFSSATFSQTRFHGKVVAEESNQPLTAASIYFNNTSIGTSTSTSGEFDIPAPGLSNAELIVSSVGYETIVYRITSGEENNHKFLFKLKKKEALMQDILILTDETRRRYLNIFKDNFLGVTEEASLSNIKNQGAIYFTKPGSESNSFNAYSDTPLIIINKKLGYRIYFQLQEFYYNKNSGITSFYGFTRYEELGDKKRWIKNRRRAYYGSTMHFFRSLINDKLDQEFFKIYIVKEDPSGPRDGSANKMEIAVPTTAAELLKADSSDTGIYNVTCKNKIMVQYNRDPASKAYLKMHVVLNSSLPTGFRSWLISSTGNFKIDKNGVLLNPLSVLFTGYWVYEKAANLLPYNYDPDETNNTIH